MPLIPPKRQPETPNHPIIPHPISPVHGLQASRRSAGQTFQAANIRTRVQSTQPSTPRRM
ncbi:hypothetical protein [Kingella sp. (in: b-proteobacteria)]|uniref:hypothetical protein n=1 Tax=Kingella sp. (in: b-proteobacteria) TaxID=2020713 RepID=UPI0026DBD8A5|nr:hypothetical protein [Kingella sp. (in: b-proteobacteria)]MDO4657670.1 hypothetical protein [Kingella sp. (in: b-proteobacteria)]